MTTHMHDESRSEDASNVSEDTAYELLRDACNADGLPYELSTHYLVYGPAIPDDLTQAFARSSSRDSLRRQIILDYRLIE